MFGKLVSEMQSNVQFKNGKITGTLKFIEGGLAESGPLAGDGNFLAFKWSEPADNVTSLKIGLNPSASGMEPVEAIDDADRNGVFKITSNTQKLEFTQSDGTHKLRQIFTLDLTLEDDGV